MLKPDRFSCSQKICLKRDPPVHWFTIVAKRCGFNSNTAAICIFIKGFWDAHNTTVKIYKKGPKTLLEVIKLVKKFKAAQHVTATLTSSAVNIMSSNDWHFVCVKTGHNGHHYPDVQFYNCKEFCCFTQDCPSKILPSRTPHHHNRLHSWPHYDYNHRDRS